MAIAISPSSGPIRPSYVLLPTTHFAITVRGFSGLTMEFNSSEVIDHMPEGWWNQLHQAVDSNALHNDWSNPQNMVDGKEAKVIGLLGVDTKHHYHAELHPLSEWPLKSLRATAVGNLPEVFARNWGDEGGCSRYQHYTNYNKISFFFPKVGGAPMIVDDAATSFHTYNAQSIWGAKQYDDGLVLSFELPPPQQSRA